MHDYVRSVHEGAQYKYEPDLALLAEIDHEIVGHIMSTNTYINTPKGKVGNVLHLAPLAVLLNMRKQGIGRQLMNASIEAARAKGYRAIFLAGNPVYYSRLGYVPSYKHNIYYAEAEQLAKEVGTSSEHIKECIMVYELFPDALKGIEGNIVLL
ncbi:MAG: N-acetyltransferase [Deferribacteraceae bacterium]|nr:N-acetyltransferase [Deferribacteraceae bacterium]